MGFAQEVRCDASSARFGHHNRIGASAYK
jgi:hypothetical protein